MSMKVIGSVGLSNTSSLNVYEVEPHGEYVVAGMNNDRPRKRKLYSTNKGFYFMFGGSRYYMHEICRV